MLIVVYLITFKSADSLPMPMSMSIGQVSMKSKSFFLFCKIRLISSSEYRHHACFLWCQQIEFIHKRKQSQELTSGSSLNFFFATFSKLFSMDLKDFVKIAFVWSTIVTWWFVAAATYRYNSALSNCHEGDTNFELELWTLLFGFISIKLPEYLIL